MTTDAIDTEELLRTAGLGDEAARTQLLNRHRDRLRRMVAVRMDRRLAARVDPSDVVQEALAEAARDLSGYLRDRPLPFYPWLRQVAWRRLVQLYRHHVVARRRSVDREEPAEPSLADASAHVLAAACLAANGSSPSRALIREELLDRVHASLAQLGPGDRDLLVMRHLEGMSAAEVGAVLGIGEGAVRVRLVRALKRLRGLLDRDESGSEARP
jgi:RNA polymerase sigma-70 factor (ECF subfamily)